MYIYVYICIYIYIYTYIYDTYIYIYIYICNMCIPLIPFLLPALYLQKLPSDRNSLETKHRSLY